MDQTKTKKKKPIGIVILIVAIILIIIGISLKPKNEAKTESKKNSNNNNETTTSTEKVDYKEYTEKYPQEKRNIDYYYNIYTPAFNKQRYNGKISLFGKIVDGPLTIQTLNNNNITYSKNHASMTTITDENTENELYDLAFTNPGTIVFSVSPYVNLITYLPGTNDLNTYAPCKSPSNV